MEETKLHPSDIVRFNGNRYRILGVTAKRISICRLDISKLDIDVCLAEELLEKVLTGEAIVELPEQTPAFDLNDLSETTREKLKERLNFANDLKDRYAPLYDSLTKDCDMDFRKKLMETYSISKTQFWRIVRVYLHSGFDPLSLLDKRSLKKKLEPVFKTKPGKKSTSSIKGVLIDDKIIEAFEYGVSCFKKKKVLTIKGAYEEMLRKYFFTTVLKDGCACYGLPEDGQYPTERQFRYYLNKRLSKKDIKIIKTSAAEYRNNERILYGDSLSGVYGPCDLWEIDACECDFELVSVFDKNIAIKRPTLYVAIDVFTRMIMGFSLSFEINSNRGFANCMMSLLEDKDELCRKYAIEAPKKFWPSMVLPNRIRCDYGSEFISHDVERMCLELGIIKENVTPGTGSLKPVVEQLFHQMNTMINQPLHKNGHISKRYGSKHYEEAKLNIEEAKKIILTFIIQHNLKQLDNYPLNRRMIKDGLSRCPTPLELWNYGLKHQGSPKIITDISRFKYALLEEKEASISRYGITMMGLHYSSPLDHRLVKKIEETGGKSIKTKIRIDTRDLSFCYRIEDNEIIRTPLSQRTDSSTFADWSLPEYIEYRQQVANAKDNANVHNLSNRIIATAMQRETIKDASKQKIGKSVKKNINENTRIEKELRRKSELIFGKNDIPNTTDEHSLPYTKNRVIDSTLSDAIERHSEDRYRKYYEEEE